MPIKYNRLVTYDEFESRVRRHRWTDVLNAIGLPTAQQVERQIDFTQDRLLLPWALASICKEAIRFGTEYRPKGRDSALTCGSSLLRKKPWLIPSMQEPLLRNFSTPSSTESRMSSSRIRSPCSTRSLDPLPCSV